MACCAASHEDITPKSSEVSESGRTVHGKVKKAMQEKMLLEMTKERPGANESLKSIQSVALIIIPMKIELVKSHFRPVVYEIGLLFGVGVKYRVGWVG
jgi:hypothetical protein